jgi:hypothetical protein
MMINNPIFLAEKSQQLANKCGNEKVAMTMQWAMLGCLFLAGTAAAVHLVKDLTGTFRTRNATDSEFDMVRHVRSHGKERHR